MQAYSLVSESAYVRVYVAYGQEIAQSPFTVQLFASCPPGGASKMSEFAAVRAHADAYAGQRKAGTVCEICDLGTYTTVFDEAACTLCPANTEVKAAAAPALRSERDLILRLHALLYVDAHQSKRWHQ